MTTDSLMTAADDTQAEGQVATPPAATPDAPQGDPAQTPPQGDAVEGGDAAQAAEYEPFAIPDGVEADEEVLAEFKGIARELKLSQEDAQHLADLSSKMEIKRQEAFKSQQTEWVEAAKADQEFGGEKFAENLAAAKGALDTFATPELRQLLNDSGLGNHPELIRFCVRIGKQISPDNTFPNGTASAPNSKDARRLYAASNMNP